MKAKLNLKGKEIVIDDIKQVSGIGKYIGLMFKKGEAGVLLFNFEFPGKYRIHSYFCQPFLAIWLKENKVVDYKLISPNSLIKPEKEFDKLIEVPFNEKYKNVFDIFMKENKL